MAKKKIKYEKAETAVMDDGTLLEMEFDLFKENVRYKWYNLEMEVVGSGEVPVERDGMEREFFVVNEMGAHGRSVYLEDVLNEE